MFFDNPSPTRNYLPPGYALLGHVVSFFIDNKYPTYPSFRTSRNIPTSDIPEVRVKSGRGFACLITNVSRLETSPILIGSPKKSSTLPRTRRWVYRPSSLRGLLHRTRMLRFNFSRTMLPRPGYLRCTSETRLGSSFVNSLEMGMLQVRQWCWMHPRWMLKAKLSLDIWMALEVVMRRLLCIRIVRILGIQFLSMILTIYQGDGPSIVEENGLASLDKPLPLLIKIYRAHPTSHYGRVLCSKPSDNQLGVRPHRSSTMTPSNGIQFRDYYRSYVRRVTQRVGVDGPTARPFA